MASHSDRRFPSPVLCVAVVVLLAASFQALRHPVVLDDAYITFRYSQNLAEGYGLVFNPGQQALSTTAPGLAALLALPALVGLDIVTSARVLCTVALAAASLCLLQLGRLAGRLFWGFAAGLLLCLHPDLAQNWGNEASLLLLAAVGGGMLFTNGRYGLSAAVLAGGCAVRPDFALLALLFAAQLLGGAWRERHWRPFVRFALVGALVSLTWMGFVFWAAGEVMPHTLAVKQLQVDWIRSGDPRAALQWQTWAGGLQHYAQQVVRYPPFAWWAIPGLLIALVLPRSVGTLDEKRASLALWPGIYGLWAILHVAAYALLDVPGHHPWYLYPVWLWMVIGGAAALEVTRMGIERALLRSGAPDHRASKLTLGLVTLILGLCAASLEIRRVDVEDHTKYEAYRAISTAILERTKPDESLMLGEIGEIGYLTGREVVDTHALIHPDLSTEAILDLAQLIDHFDPELIVDEGWVTAKPPGYVEAVSAGVYRLEIPLPDCTLAEYEQIAGEGHPPSTYMPAVLRRVAGRR